MEKIDKQAVIKVVNDHFGLYPYKLIDKIKALPTYTDEWVSVSDKPKTDGLYLCLVPCIKFKHTEIEFKNGDWVHCAAYITHWMPLPNAPTK